MKNTLPAMVILAAILGLCFFSARTTERDTLSRQAELQQAESLIQAQRWEEARHTLGESYQHWSEQQRYLRILSTHSLLDEVDCLYHRVMTFAAMQEQGELAADLIALREQLSLLALREQPTLGNIL